MTSKDEAAEGPGRVLLSVSPCGIQTLSFVPNSKWAETSEKGVLVSNGLDLVGNPQSSLEGRL